MAFGDVRQGKCYAGSTRPKKKRGLKAPLVRWISFFSCCYHSRRTGCRTSHVPSPAYLLDNDNRLIDRNHRYLELFFPDQPGVARPGTPLEVLAHAWGNNQGFEPKEIEA